MAADERRRFARFAAAGILFQGGAVTLDTSTFVAAFVHGLTGSSAAVAAAAAISRIGWLVPQLVVAHFAQGRARRMPFYMIGAFGRASCVVLLVVALALSGTTPAPALIAVFFVLWTAYAFISGIVAVPYNDIVARAIPSDRRSRLLGLRFFGGGLLAVAVAGLANQALDRLPFLRGYALVFLIGAVLLLGSASAFVSAGEPPAPTVGPPTPFTKFLREGIDVLRSDRRFRLFLGAQWLGAAVAMAFPFYVIEAKGAGLSNSDVAILVAAQTAGAIASNPVIGWWGDRFGKLSLVRLSAAAGFVAPALTLAWLAFAAPDRLAVLVAFCAVFAVLGAADNTRTIAYLGYLMEISPNDRRPAYSGYFNVLVAPAWLSPFAAAALAEAASLTAVFVASATFAVLHVLVVRRLGDARTGSP